VLETVAEPALVKLLALMFKLSGKAIKATNDETADEPGMDLDQLRDGKIWRMQEK
jgi:hypothetical protein